MDRAVPRLQNEFGMYLTTTDKMLLLHEIDGTIKLQKGVLKKL